MHGPIQHNFDGVVYEGTNGISHSKSCYKLLKLLKTLVLVNDWVKWINIDAQMNKKTEELTATAHLSSIIYEWLCLHYSSDATLKIKL